MLQVQITVTGTTPLLMHNPQLVDKENPLTRQIAALATKRKKTDEDMKAIERLEWYGGLYTAPLEDGGVMIVQPTAKVRKCLINTARISKMGKMVERALSLNDLTVPLRYDGPPDIDTLFADATYHSRLSVVVGGKRVMRVRPHFPKWEIAVAGIFAEDVGMNIDDLERIVALAGVVEGIGDNRVNGYGRFRGAMTWQTVPLPRRTV